ncbi:hypothetical protein JCM19239_6989 [Vibrio variabilis]|uniref:TfoX C-terminal domain-containing protein n=1 Tax=Vibrio variabilis TaxID=990271 RepID=A0ABQ0JRD5_9VIBR|nr:hypothetical protein JCM19239_6989 [Vibrio variabilis]
MCEEVWTAGLKEKIKKETPTRIKDLPNMQYKTERMLRKAGITSIDELREQGPSTHTKPFASAKRSILVSTYCFVLLARSKGFTGPFYLS